MTNTQTRKTGFFIIWKPRTPSFDLCFCALLKTKKTLKYKFPPPEEILDYKLESVAKISNCLQRSQFRFAAITA